MENVNGQIKLVDDLQVHRKSRLDAEPLFEAKGDVG
jgi:hypothetical protein